MGLIKNKSGVSFLVVFVVFAIIGIVGFLLMALVLDVQAGGVSDLRKKTEESLYKQISICKLDNTTKYSLGGWGNTTAYNTDVEQSFDARRGMSSLHATHTDAGGTIGTTKAGITSVEIGDIWNITVYPYVRFSYKIEEDAPLCVLYHSTLGTWHVMAATADASSDCNSGGTYTPIVDFKTLISDGEWHDVELRITSTGEADKIETNTNELGKLGEEYWLDEFVLAADSAYQNQTYCTGFEDFESFGIRTE